MKFLFRLLITTSFFHCCLGNEFWNRSLTYEEIVQKAQAGYPYYMGLLGIYLRSGEAGCRVNFKAAKQWSEAALNKGHPFGSYNLANLAMLKGDFSEATRYYQDAALLLQRSASSGDPVSMYCMGEIDFQVKPTNISRALDYFQKSADTGFPQAQATLGSLYLKGLPGILSRDSKKGITLISEAVRAKSMTARFNLGMAYYNGEGVAQDSEKAIQWLKVAEKQNFAEAQYRLGVLLSEGSDNIPQDLSQGTLYLRKAAGQDHKLATDYLKKKVSSSPSNTSYENKSLTRNSTPKLQNEAILNEARQYYTGVGRNKDYHRAYKMLLPLAQNGFAEAARLIGLMKLSGKGTDKNLSDAKKWLSMAAENGDSLAKRMLEQYKSLF